MLQACWGLTGALGGPDSGENGAAEGAEGGPTGILDSTGDSKFN